MTTQAVEALRELLACKEQMLRYKVCAPDSPRHKDWDTLKAFPTRDVAAWAAAQAALDAVDAQPQDGEPGYNPVPTKIVGTAQVVRDAQPKQEPVAWRHVANEWADMAHNGIDYVKNIKDGITTPDEALQWLAGDLKHCREVTAAAAPTAQPLSEERIERALRYCRDVKESGTATERVVAQTVLSLLSPE